MNDKRGSHRKKVGKGKVISMPALARQESSREQRLFEARKLSESITKKTSAAGLSETRIKNDVHAAYREVKISRRPGCN